MEGHTTGLGLLPLDTEMVPAKLTRATPVAFGAMPAPWAALSGLDAWGYEIRNGQVSGDGCEVAPLVWADGPVLATTVHGLLEDPHVLNALLGVRPAPVLEDTFELLADAVDAHLDTDALWKLVG